MAAPETLRFGKFQIWVESADSPGEYEQPCGLTEKAFNITMAPQEVDIPDCADPDQVGWTGRDPGPLSATFSGGGLFAIETYPIWRSWMIDEGGASRNVRVVFSDADAGYYAGAAVLTTLGHASSFRGRIQANVEGASDGVWTWTDGLPA